MGAVLICVRESEKLWRKRGGKSVRAELALWRKNQSPMKQFNKKAAWTVLAAGCLLVGAAPVSAQNQGGQGNFDPAQMRQQMMERMREQFEVKDDAEWTLISQRIEKVNEARRAMGGGGGGFGGFGGPGGPGGRPPGGAQDGGPGGGGGGARGGGGPGGPGGFGGGGPGGFNRQPDPAAEALQKTIEAKGTSEEIKAKLAQLREARKEKEAKLEKAQADLRQVLTARQEALAVLMGMLK